MEPLQPGDPRKVGRYVLSGRLGAGGMGRVFYGRSPGGRPVAVKVVRSEYGAEADFRRRFAQEVEAAKRVGGFYTAQVVDADPDSETPWLVTAYVPGPSLRDAVQEGGPFPLEDARTLGAALTEGLIAIHECGLVHRDLKPGNVIMGPDGPRVIDFGIARALDVTSATVTGQVVGTPAYMSPEQALGRRTGPASDVFSLGSVLAFAVTGAVPFGTGALAAVVYRVVNEEPDLGGVPEEIRDVIARCLAKDPEARPGLHELLGILPATPGPGPDRPEPDSEPDRPEPEPDSKPEPEPDRPEPGRSEGRGEGGSAIDSERTALAGEAAPTRVSPGSQAVFRQSRMRELFGLGTLGVLALSVATPAILGIKALRGADVEGWLWFSGAFGAAMVAIVLFLVATGDKRLVVDDAGLALRQGKREWRYPWDDIGSLTFQGVVGSGPQWPSRAYLTAAPRPDADLAGDWAASGPGKIEFIHVIDVAALENRPYQDIVHAVARHSGGRVRVEHSGTAPGEVTEG